MAIEDGEDIVASDFKGLIVLWGTNTPPTGWLICDGSAISRTTYADLFAIIGTTCGAGDGSTTFNLPNMKGKVVVGRDSADTDFDTLAETGGEKEHTLTTDEMPAHVHGGVVVAGTGGGGGAGSNTRDTDTETASAGGGQAHNNLQPYVVFNYIIKT